MNVFMSRMGVAYLPFNNCVVETCFIVFMKSLPFGVKLSGLGSGIPSKIVTNQDLEKFLDTNSEWIESRTGIKERRVCDLDNNENSLSLAVKASTGALGSTAATEIDLIIVATSTPDFLYPSTACRLQNELGASKAVGMDLSAACSGFIFALVTASQFIQLGTYSKVLVVGVDIHSRFMDWSDRSTSILFGDGAGAVLLEQTSTENNQLLSHAIHSDGSGGCDLALKCVGGEFPNGKIDKTIETVTMNGRKIYQFAVKTIPESLNEISQKAGIKIDEIDYLICHQANQRIMDSVAEKLGWANEKCLSNIAKYGNTSAASIPLAWNEFKHILRDNSNLALSGFGAGLTWGSILWKWKAN
jgi:3-oxoacyl-[acyl-carrier-protein] synthase-3